MRESEIKEFQTECTDNYIMELKIGTTLRTLMADQRLTLKEVSKACGVSISTLHEWENNRAPRNPIQVAKVAKFLGVNLTYLLFAEDDSSDPISKLIKNEVFSGTYEISIKKVKMPKP